jgi:hypothetical protein
MFSLSDEGEPGERGERGESLGDGCIDADFDWTTWLGKSPRRSSKVVACIDLRLNIKFSMGIKLIGGPPHVPVKWTKRVESKQEITAQAVCRQIYGGSICRNVETRFHIKQKRLGRLRILQWTG